MKIQFAQAMKILRALPISLLAGVVLPLQAAPAPSIPAQTVTRNTSFEYYPNGLLKKKQIEPDAAVELALTVDYTYDAASGNRLTETQSDTATSNKKQRVVASNWEASARFQKEAINPLLQKEQYIEYDERFGLVKKRIDLNGQMTVWEYDDFGRKITERRGYANKDATAYLNYTTWSYERCGDVSCTAIPGVTLAYVVTATTLSSQGVQIAPTVKVYYDVLNREVRTETQVVTATTFTNVTNVTSTRQTVYKDTQYDERGNVYKVSQPYLSTATAQWTVTTRDELGRTTLETAPNNQQTQTDYDGLTTTRTVKLTTGDRVTTSLANALGQQVKAKDALGNSTFYVYDALGKLSHVVNPYGDLVETVHNIRGHRTSINDPNLGLWTYKPNTFGDVESQPGPLGKTTYFKVDDLGRVTERKDSDLITYFEYDTAANGIGALAKVWTDNGYCRIPAYDTLGRLETTTLKLGAGSNACSQATSYVSKLSYDDVGRVSTQTFPTGLKVKNVYDATLGTLLAVKRYTGNTEGTAYWQRTAGDAAGRITDFIHGNNVATQRSFDANSMGWLTGIVSGTIVADVGDIQRSSYGHDTTGQLSSRKDKFELPNVAAEAVSERFVVDALGRLRTVGRYTDSNTLIADSQIDTTYDAIGRIKTKSDTGTFYYARPADARPHAVTAVRGSAYSATYDYDAAGQMTARAGQSYVYTDSGHLRMGGTASTCHEFLMQGEGLRVRQTIYGAACKPSNAGSPVLAQTTYMHPDASNGLAFEVETKGGIATYRHYINADGRPIALVTSASASIASDQAAGLKTTHLHYDHLGSIVVVTDAAGAVVERRSFDPWGNPRALNGTAGSGELPGGLAGEATDRGFTLHEHLEGLGLIHMNGRVYDPRLGRFTSADPLVSVPGDLQSYDRYAYVMNRPLDAGDPTGYAPEPVGPSLSGSGGSSGGLGFFGFSYSWSFGGSGNSAISFTGNGQTAGGQIGNIAFSGYSGPSTLPLEQSGGTGFSSFGDAAKGSHRSDLSNFFDHIDLSGTARQFGLRLMTDFVNNNKGTWGGWGWLADKADTFFDKPDHSANAVVAKVASTAATLFTPGGFRQAAAQEMVTVGRWMSTKELSLMKSTGRVVEGAGGGTSVATSGAQSFVKQAKSGSVYVEFSVPKVSLVQGGQADWFKLVGPSAPRSMQFTLQKQGGEMLPTFENLSEVKAVIK